MHWAASDGIRLTTFCARAIKQDEPTCDDAGTGHKAGFTHGIKLISASRSRCAFPEKALWRWGYAGGNAELTQGRFLKDVKVLTSPSPDNNTVKRQKKGMRITKTGIVFCSLYLIASGGCVIWAQFISDPKGKYIILQMPVVLQHGLLLAFDATQSLKDMNWAEVYLVLGVPMLVFLVLLGFFIESIAFKICSGASALNKALHRTSR